MIDIPRSATSCQNTPEWIAARLAHVTASPAACLLVKGKAAHGWGAGAITYADTLLAELMTGQGGAELNTPATRWGHEYEDEARQVYVETTGIIIDHVGGDGFTRHPTEANIGASMDGLTRDGSGGLIEIKCPYTSKEHVRRLREPKPDKEHFAQMQFQMWIAEAGWCDYVSYDPRMNEQFHILIVPTLRDEAFIANLAERVIAFRDFVFETLTEILDNLGG